MYCSLYLHWQHLLLLTVCLLFVFMSLRSRVMSSKQATSPFASVVDGDNAMSQENLSWEKEESAEAHGTPQLPLHSLLHGKAHPDEVQPLNSVTPESDWDSLVSAQQRMVRRVHTLQTALVWGEKINL